ncbi:dTDP-glucose 4,6-dehydratase [Clostridium sp. D2Q-11]|uniref:dTDP-glucose 4,6-dehydratase n=1 Tax=Anaeromonas frigoriresistens TaxID=2683708 RepID=A0A942UUC3_9FIRM|nr:dTDP-glucose 4,6-dehydratase [Anaeromonas frigoriresistens]MBS4539283.1 dTDP-glucose 4,6-dehydratase [Anaeromonas frigoriresistens]
MKTYLITGGAGFIGSNHIKYMLKKYDNIKLIVLDKLTYAGNLKTLETELDKIEFIKGDICNKDLVSEIFKNNKVDYVINFAAESHVDRSIENPQLFLETNILGTQNLLDAALKSWTIGEDIYIGGVEFLQVSTDEVYGSLGDTGYFTENTPLNPRSPYSASKTSADLIVQAYIETYKFPAKITRCSNNYGAYQFPEKLIPLIIKNVLEGKELPVYGDGTNIRDWLYVEDHCKALDMVLNDGKLGEVYNIGGHNEKQNIEIVKLIIDIINDLMSSKPEYKTRLKTDISNINYDLIRYVKDRKGHDKRYAIDPTKIKNELGWYPETKFEDGIIKTIIWYLKNAEWVENVVSGDYQNYYEKMYKDR